jgi:primosomal protein N' (replication factor Y)
VPAGVTPKPIADVLDTKPLFGPDLLRLFDWEAKYYHESLGEVIRAGLPAGLSQDEVRTVSLTSAGEEKLRAVMDTSLSKAERSLLTALLTGPVQLAELARAHKTRVAAILALAERGLVDLRAKQRNTGARAKLESVVEAALEAKALAASRDITPKDRAVLDLLRASGPLPMAALRERFGRVAPNIARLAAKGAVVVEQRRVFRNPGAVDANDSGGTAVGPPLNPRQAQVVAAICNAVDGGQSRGFLLYGATGSGKTEVYLRAIAHVLAQGKGAIVLVPEIALTPQLLGRFQARFGERIAVLHSALSPGERVDQWEQIQSGHKPVVVGARSAIFAPVPRLGLVVVDEEHEQSFKQGERPRYHARDLALVRGQQSDCPVVLGSATPSLESFHNAAVGKLVRLDMPERARQQPMPVVELVDLRVERGRGNTGFLSYRLARALVDTVSRGEQAIVLINRRGFSSFLLCTHCGNIPECPNCSISLTYSQSARRLRCHYCGHEVGVPSRCAACNGAELDPVGIGTERAQEEVQNLLGAAVRVERMDRDTAQGSELLRLLGEFRRGQIQVLIGTQMVAKGHDFPNVTLVGVLAADQALRLPDFRASERAFQLVTQVAGRAGRGDLPGRVIVQSYSPEHHSLTAAVDHSYPQFAAPELEFRRMQDYPPFSFLALVLVTHTDEAAAGELATRLAALLRAASSAIGSELWVLGPAFAPVQRIKSKTRVHILLKARQRAALHQLLARLDRVVDEENLSAQVAVDVDPLQLL